MSDTRARFEEIWPVPRGITWSECGYGYEPTPPNLGDDYYYELACEWDARLDTFTRCQETMAPVLSIVDELVAELETWLEIADPDCGDPECTDCSTWVKTRDIVDRAKKLLESPK